VGVGGASGGGSVGGASGGGSVGSVSLCGGGEEGDANVLAILV
jgi:hypothetical protein